MGLEEVTVHAEITFEIGRHALRAELATFVRKGRAMPDSVLQRTGGKLEIVRRI
jgi:hypothetical protein